MLDNVMTEISRFQHILPLCTVQINCSGTGMTFLRRLTISHKCVVLLVLKGSILGGLAINFNGAVGNE
jgi:hypothetical protein